MFVVPSLLSVMSVSILPSAKSSYSLSFAVWKGPSPAVAGYLSVCLNVSSSASHLPVTRSNGVAVNVSTLYSSVARSMFTFRLLKTMGLSMPLAK